MKRGATPLEARLAALGRAADLADGRLEPEVVARAREVVARAGARLGLDLETTVAALAGPTGAGKSSLFNALAGRELARAGVRRPTTSRTTAAVWGAPDEALLDWLGAATRHGLGGERPLVLLDLPDFDSVERANREEVERVLQLADLLVWVTDPQKYADATLHERYLRPLAGYRDVMVAVLNQADRLEGEALRACQDDLRRLLAEDGLDGLPVLAVSARDGTGLPALRALLDERADRREAAVARLAADVTAAAGALAATATGATPTGAGSVDSISAGASRSTQRLGRGAEGALVSALADAAGVPVVTRAVARGHRRAGVLAAGWPPARWLLRLRPDPLKRLRLGDADVKTSLPPATPVQRSRVSSALRELAATAGGDLPGPWPGLVRRAATAREEMLPDALDRAVAGTQLPQRRPRWWVVAGLLQRALALVVLAGLLWLAVVAGLGFLQLQDAVPVPDLEGVPLPTLLLVGGLLGGLVLALLARYVTAIGAARRARRADRALRAAVAEVAEAQVLAPVRAELAARDELLADVREATGRRGQAQVPRAAVV